VLDGRLTAYRTYNAPNQLLETIDTADRHTKYRYDGAGRLVLIEDSHPAPLRSPGSPPYRCSITPSWRGRPLGKLSNEAITFVSSEWTS
jgi:YD repeat-containing protein